MDEAILGATVAVLRERGWSGTTIEEVAARAGVGKTSIYRRYPSKVTLVADAATRDRESVFPSFDTGSAAGDLMAFVLGSLRRLLGSVWQDVLPGVLAEAAEDPDV
ncbi:MAG TPA: TetR/AcrR family transcriptional regulator, partial [Actinomycetota bacterium]|nr:TetR/AcrR family transcriptional regulator [Actinomycetota bacterium]